MIETLQQPTDDHTQFSPEQWTEILHNALKAHRANPQDHEALEAIKAANTALNAYEQPAIIAGERTLDSGWGNPVEAVKGVAEGGVQGLLAPIHLGATLVRQGPDAVIDELVSGLKAIPGELMSGDPRRLGNLTGQTAAGIAYGRAGVKLNKAAGALTELAERPALKNALLKEQTANAQARTVATTEVGKRASAGARALNELADQRAARAPIQEEILNKRNTLLEEQVQGAPQRQASAFLDQLARTQKARQADLRTTSMQAANEAAARSNPVKQTILEQERGRGPGTQENLDLRNELLRRKLEALDMEIPTNIPGAGVPGEGVPFPGPTPPGRPMTDIGGTEIPTNINTPASVLDEVVKETKAKSKSKKSKSTPEAKSKGGSTLDF